MNRIDELFERKKHNILSVFYTAGYPQLNDTVPLARYLEEAGADMIELGIPFSDPIADGPVIQRSNASAIANGMTIRVLLSQVEEIRRQVNMPLVLMGYLNPVMQYGLDNFFTDAARAGADGIILPDLPAEEFKDQYREKARRSGLHVIFLVAPSSPDWRIRMLDSLSSGFLYAVSLSGVTGARTAFSDEQKEFLNRLRHLKLRNPVLAGFGISTAEGFRTVSSIVNGAIVGSAYISALEQGNDLNKQTQNFIRKLTENSVHQP